MHTIHYLMPVFGHLINRTVYKENHVIISYTLGCQEYLYDYKLIYLIIYVYLVTQNVGRGEEYTWASSLSVLFKTFVFPDDKFEKKNSVLFG